MKRASFGTIWYCFLKTLCPYLLVWHIYHHVGICISYDNILNCVCDLSSFLVNYCQNDLVGCDCHITIDKILLSVIAYCYLHILWLIINFKINWRHHNVGFIIIIGEIDIIVNPKLYSWCMCQQYLFICYIYHIFDKALETVLSFSCI